MKELKWYSGEVNFGEVPAELWEGHIGTSNSNSIVACTPDGRKIKRGSLVYSDGASGSLVDPELGFELDRSGRVLFGDWTRVVVIAQEHGWTPGEETGVQNSNNEQAVRQMKIAYIAGAYSGATPEEVDLNIAAAKHIGTLVARLGFGVIIPHCNSAGMERVAPDISKDFWLKSDIEIMKRCDLVVMVPGWENSEGAKEEYRIAQSLSNIRVYSSYHSLWETMGS